MSQSRRWSIYETITNTVIGIIVNVVLNFTFITLMGLRGREAYAFTGIMSVVFLVTSVLRAYIIRRIFNRISPDD